MIKAMCSLLDLQTGLFCDPFISLNYNQAIVRFGYACSIDYQSTIFHECEKYDLYAIGQFDDVTGEFMPEKKLLAAGSSHVELRDINREKYYAKAILEENEEVLKS